MVLDTKKSLILSGFLFSILLIAGIGQAAEYGKISTCESTPLCIIPGNSSSQPKLIEPASEETKETFEGLKENTSAEWEINATGQRRYVNITVLAEVPENPYVQSKRGEEHRKEIQIKGLIPETDTLGHPFYMANYSAGQTYKNPQELPANTNEFQGNDEFEFNSYVNVSDAPEESEWNVFMFANSTNPHVDQKYSDNGTIRIAGPVTNKAPTPATLNSPSNNTVFTETDSVILNVTVSDPDGDNMSVVFNHFNPDFNEKNTGVENGTSTSINNNAEQGRHSWEVCVCDGKKNTKTPENTKWYYTVDSTAPKIIGNIQPSITFPNDWSGVNYDADDVGTDNFIWDINNTDRFNISSFGKVNNEKQLAAGYYNINLSVEDDENDVNFTNIRLQVSKATPDLSLSTNGSTYPDKAVINASASNIQDSDLEYNLYIDDKKINSGTNINQMKRVSGGTHTAVYNTSGGENYTSNSVTQTFTVNKSKTDTDIFFKNNRISVKNQNISFNEGGRINVTASVNIPRTQQVNQSNLVLKYGSNLIGSINANNRTATDFQPSQSKNVIANFTGNENYSKSHQIQNISINQKPEIGNISVNRTVDGNITFEMNVSDDKNEINEIVGLTPAPTKFTNDTLKFETSNLEFNDTIKVRDSTQLESDPADLNISVEVSPLRQSSRNTSDFERQFIEKQVNFTNNGNRNLSFNSSFSSYGERVFTNITEQKLVHPGDKAVDKAVYRTDNISINISKLNTSTEKVAVGSNFIGVRQASIENNASVDFLELNASAVNLNRCFQTNLSTVAVDPDSVENKSFGLSCKAADYSSSLSYSAVRQPFKHTFNRGIDVHRNLTEVLWEIDLDELPQFDNRVNETVSFNSVSKDVDVSVVGDNAVLNLGRVGLVNSEARFNYSVSSNASVVERVSGGIERNGDFARLNQPSPLFSQFDRQKDFKSVIIENALSQSNTYTYYLGDGCEDVSIQKGRSSRVYGDKGAVRLDSGEKIELSVREDYNSYSERLNVLDSCTIDVESALGGERSFDYRSSPVLFSLFGPVGLLLAGFVVWSIGVWRTIRIVVGGVVLFVPGLYDWRLSGLLVFLYVFYRGIVYFR